MYIIYKNYLRNYLLKKGLYCLLDNQENQFILTIYNNENSFLYTIVFQYCNKEDKCQYKRKIYRLHEFLIKLRRYVLKLYKNLK